MFLRKGNKSDKPIVFLWGCLITTMLLCIVLSVFGLKNEETGAYALDANPLARKGNYAYFNYKEDHILETTVLNIPVSVVSESNIMDYSYNETDFEVLSSKMDNSHSLLFTLKCLFFGEYELHIHIIMSDKTELIASLYAVCTDFGIFLSDTSQSAALKKYIDYALDNSILTEGEAEEIVERLSSKSSIDEEDVIEVNNSTKNKRLVAKSSTRSGDTTAYGTLTWNDGRSGDIGIHPLRGIKVELRDSDLIGSQLLGTVYTDNNGDYSLSFTNDSSVFENGGCDLFLRIYAGDNNAYVVQSNGMTKYYIDTPYTDHQNVATGSQEGIDYTVEMSSDKGKAMQISQALMTAQDFAWNMMGIMPASVKVRYPYGTNGCYYNSDDNMITITGVSRESSDVPESYASWDVIMHEYGHHIAEQLGIDDSPGGWHTLGINMADHYATTNGDACRNADNCARHGSNPTVNSSTAKEAGMKLAWSEAWATCFGGIAQNYYSEVLSDIWTTNDHSYSSYNGVIIDYETACVNSTSFATNGDSCEGSVLCVLWDLFDGGTEYNDTISLGYQAWWSVTTGNQSKLFHQFAQYFYSEYPQYRLALGANLTYYQIAPSEVISNLTGTSLSVPPTVTWVQQGGSTTYQNDRFMVQFFSADPTVSPILTVYTTNTSYTVTNADWNSILELPGETFYISVVGYQTSTPSTGGYYGRGRGYKKPIYVTTVKADNTLEITGTRCDLIEDITVPATIDGRQVTSIAANAFSYKHLTGITLPSTITAMGAGAFRYCTNLMTVDLSATAVTRIEAYTFDSCPLGHFTFPPYLVYVGVGAFMNTGEVGAMPNSVTTIDDYAFSYRETSFGLYLPDGLLSIGAYSFAYSEGYIINYGTNLQLTTIGPYAFYETNLPLCSKLPISVITIGDSAFRNSYLPNDFALAAGGSLTTIGDNAFRNCELKNIVLPTSITTIGSNVFADDSELTIYTEYGSKPSGWNSAWNGSNRPVVWGCTLSNDKTYVKSFTKSTSNPSNASATNGVNNPIRSGYSFGGWYTTSDHTGTKYDDIASAPNGTLYAKWSSSSCLASGSLITLADGSQVAVENLTGNETLLVWNLLTGQYDTAPILFIDSDAYASYEVITLTFSDNTQVKLISEHAFFDMTLGEYVFLRSDAAQYIGHSFNKKNGNAWTTVQLTNVSVGTEYTMAWSPVTYGHLCYYVNGMLSMPGGTEGLVNIFDVDTTLMKYDAEQMASDIQTYGLCTYEEFNAILSLPELVFDAFNGQYLKVSIGKDLITLAEIAELLNRYAAFFAGA